MTNYAAMNIVEHVPARRAQWFWLCPTDFFHSTGCDGGSSVGHSPSTHRVFNLKSAPISQCFSHFSDEQTKSDMQYASRVDFHVQ